MLRHEVFEKLLEAAPDPILMVDGAGIIQIANQQSTRVFGYSLEELVGNNVDLLVPAELRIHHQQLRTAYHESPKIRPMGLELELKAQRKDGSRVPVEISLSPVKIDGAQFTIVVVRDASATKKHQAELQEKADALERSNQELEQFASVASHDLQEPLRMISGYTQLLERRYGDKLDEEAKQYIKHAFSGAKFMQELISDLLLYSRVTTKGELQEVVDLDDIRAQVLANLQVAIADSKADIRWPTEMPKVRGDRTQLVQLFQNLLSNALKFRSDKCRVDVTIEPADNGSRIEVVVADNGIGIEAADYEKIFLIFQRLHDRDKYQGTGIGLAIAKKIVERHGGVIRVESRVGEGTKFIFQLLRQP